MDILDIKIREIKISRSYKCYLDDLFSSLIVYEHEDYIYSLFLKKINGDVLFQIDEKFNVIYMNSDIFNILLNKYHMEVNDINNIIKKYFLKYYEFTAKVTAPLTQFMIDKVKNNLTEYKIDE